MSDFSSLLTQLSQVDLSPPLDWLIRRGEIDMVKQWVNQGKPLPTYLSRVVLEEAQLEILQFLDSRSLIDRTSLIPLAVQTALVHRDTSCLEYLLSNS